MISDITTNLEANRSPIFNLQNCELEASSAQTLRMDFTVK